MRRRELMLVLAGAVTAAGALRAQQKVPVIGYLSSFSPPATPPDRAAAFRQGLSETGYVEGQNVSFEYRWADDHYDRLPRLAAELVRAKVDLIATADGTPAALAAKSATSTIPIVFALVSDPVGAGLVESLARPGGNVTGFGNMTTELMPKRLELLSELVPQARVIALLVNPTNAYTEPMIRVVQEAAQARGLQLPILQASNVSEIDRAFGSLAELGARGLVIGAEPFLSGSRREQLVALASRYAIPAIYEARDTAAAGGLISYGVDLTDLSRQAEIYAGRILKSVKPGDLPVQEPAKFELVVNLKTAKSLGLTVPPSILARADEVIE